MYTYSVQVCILTVYRYVFWQYRYVFWQCSGVYDQCPGICLVTCRYKRVGPHAATCVDGQWSPDSKPYCVPVQHPRLLYIFRGKRSLPAEHIQRHQTRVPDTLHTRTEDRHRIHDQNENEAGGGTGDPESGSSAVFHQGEIAKNSQVRVRLGTRVGKKGEKHDTQT